ncbi:MAG TPA: branched-chain amino acid ABC transporter permease [Chloroflexota bacterium]|jgi:branched-chain amino acid transport system permease protein|nr:branched-chain amino acid ABC transporter permease [Chloroflexota bacterium]
MDGGLLAQAVLNGLLLGGIYALVALGFSLVWGVMNVINVSHGAFVMLGAFTTYWLFVRVGLDPFLGAPVAMALMFVLGYLLQKYVINLIVRAPMFMTLILTFGINLVIVNLGIVAWTGDVRSITTGLSGQGVVLGPFVVPYVRAATLLIALLATTALFVFMDRTRTGSAIRATRMDLLAAEGVGIRIDRIYALTFAIGAALAGLAGALISVTLPITPFMGFTYTGKAFVVTALGGLGNMAGALVGGLVLGVAETVGAALLGPGYQDAIGYALLVLILVLRPSGLLGRVGYA